MSKYSPLIPTRPNLVSEALIAERRRIPDEPFVTCLHWLPVLTADFVVTRTVDGQRQFGLGWRTEEPFQNTWFVPGGRVFWGEIVWNALRRNVHHELDFDIEAAGVAVKERGVLPVLNPASKTGGRPEPWVSYWNFHEIMVNKSVQVSPRAENARFGWFTEIDQSWPEPVKTVLLLIGFRLAATDDEVEPVEVIEKAAE